MIKVRGLTKEFRSRRKVITAVGGVDLDVAEGELVGFLGPNGAGKTTTLRMLATLLRPTAGEALVAGCDLRTDPSGVRSRIGYVGQGNGAGHNQQVGHELINHAQMYGMSSTAARTRVHELLERYELAGMAGRTVQTLSGGQRRRLDIVLGVLHQPQLVFLDEPSTALDPQSRNNLWQHIRSLRDDHGSTIFLTTHYLDEVDALCERIIVIDGGRIIAEDTPSRLKSEVSGDLVVIEVTDPAGATTVAARLPGVKDLATDQAIVSLRVPRGDTVAPELMRLLDQAGIGVRSIRIQPPTLDDVFLNLTGRRLRDVDAEPGADVPPTDG